MFLKCLPLLHHIGINTLENAGGGLRHTESESNSGAQDSPFKKSMPGDSDTQNLGNTALFSGGIHFDLL